jgi:transcription antitermination factor NusG
MAKPCPKMQSDGSPRLDGTLSSWRCLHLLQEVVPVSFDAKVSNELSEWFALCTLPRHEKRVADLIAQRQVELFLPLYQQERQWKKRPPVILDLPLFPTYLFVRIQHSERGSVLSVPGVLSLVGNGRQPLPIPEAEIEHLRAGMGMRSAEPQPYLAVGERVRVTGGPLAGYEGLLIRKNNELRVVISVERIQQSISVEVDQADVESLSTPRA